MIKPRRTRELPESIRDKGLVPDANDAAEYWHFAEEPSCLQGFQDALEEKLSGFYRTKRNPTGRALSQSQLESLRKGAARMLQGLARATQLDPSKKVYRSSARRKFDLADKIPFDVFSGCVHSLVKAGFIQSKVMNRPRLTTEQGKVVSAGCNATRYSITEELITFLRQLGVDPANDCDPFLAPDLIVLREQKKSSERKPQNAKKQQTGGALDFDKRAALRSTSTYSMILKDIERLNAFIGEQTFGDRMERPPRITRIFHFKEDPATDFKYGGRLYASGDSYQTWPAEEGQDKLKIKPSEVRVRDIKINGEPVVALDVHASFPFLAEYLLHYTPDYPHREDFYCIPQLAEYLQGPETKRMKIVRNAAKTVCMHVFGSGKSPGRFNAGEKVKRGFSELQLSAPKIFEIVAEHRETIRNFASPDYRYDWGDLHYIESEAFLIAIKELMKQGIPSLPVHDELIVPVSKEKQAKAAILKGYSRFHVGGELPLIKATHVPKGA